MKKFKSIRANTEINEAYEPTGIEAEIHRGLDHKNYHERFRAITHPEASPRNIRKALDDSDSKIRVAGASHQNASSQNLIKSLNDVHPSVRIAAIRNPNIGPEHLIRALDDRHRDVRTKALTSAVRHPDVDVRKAAIRRSDITPSHIDHALDDSHQMVRYYAARHSNASPENLKKASKDSDPVVREASKRGIKEGWDQGEEPTLRLVKTHIGPKGHVAKVYKDQDWNEYRVKFFSPEGKHLEDADSHHDDKEEANDTAAYQVFRGIKEELDLDEDPGIQLIKTHTGPKGHVAKVYKELFWNERDGLGHYCVKFFNPEGKYLEDRDADHDNKEDANNMAARDVLRGYHG